MNETFERYVALLCSLVKICWFGDLDEEMIRDRIVLGIRDNNTRKIQEKGLGLYLQRWMDIGRASEVKSSLQLRVIKEVQFVKKVTKPMSDKQRKDPRDKHDITCEYFGFRYRNEQTDYQLMEMSVLNVDGGFILFGFVLERPLRNQDLAGSRLQRNQYTMWMIIHHLLNMNMSLLLWKYKVWAKNSQIRACSISGANEKSKLHRNMKNLCPILSVLCKLR